MTLHVHLLNQPAERHVSILRTALMPGITVTTGDEVPLKTNILVAGRPNRRHLADRPALRMLLIPFAGLPAETRALMQEHPHIAVHNLHHNAIPTAETAIALLLAAAKFIVPADRDLRKGDWSRRYQPNPAVLLHGKTVLILGYGAIGQHIASICRALGMQVMAVRRSQPQPNREYPDTIYPLASLHEILPRTDALVSALPLTDETRGLIGTQELALLPAGAILVNVGRGLVIDEAALYHALKNGTLHAAGLDVWYRYPETEAARSSTFPSAFPFHLLDNVIMTPHRAGSGGADEIEGMRMQAIARIVNLTAEGGPVPDRVDLDAGY